jgi:MazG family protein
MYLLEEAYEVVDAVERGSSEELCQELGDLLFQIVFLTRLAQERGEFDLLDVVKKISEKMKNRHPHVFGQTTVKTPEDVADNWEKIKRREKGAPKTLRSQLESVPIHLPALLRAHRLSHKASKADSGRASRDNSWGRVEEDLNELGKTISAGDREAFAQKIGELLFGLANLAREWGLNAEHLLRSANQKFIERYREP